MSEAWTSPRAALVPVVDSMGVDLTCFPLPLDPSGAYASMSRLPCARLCSKFLCGRKQNEQSPSLRSTLAWGIWEQGRGVALL